MALQTAHRSTVSANMTVRLGMSLRFQTRQKRNPSTFIHSFTAGEQKAAFPSEYKNRTETGRTATTNPRTDP